MKPGSPEEDWREDCAPRRVLELFATKWTSMVLHTLHVRHAGAARTGVLQRSLPGISKKMLVQTLREFPRQALHARFLELDHPVTGQRMKWESPLPDDFVWLLTLLQQDREAFVG